ncbi:MAG: carboxylating nicotinate-nucleotide diphosphorylase [Bacilli bacterium]
MFLTDSVRELIRLALAEDIGRGDCTTDLIVAADAQANGQIWIKQAARVAGAPFVEAVFHALDPALQVTVHVPDGDDAAERMIVCEVAGNARALLYGERTALNFLGRLSGVATLTREAVERVRGTGVKILDTRKTTPGWRSLEKYAVRMGGGHNHRFGLDDMILLKDNHIALAGGVSEALARAHRSNALALKIEVEVDTLEQLELALEAGADVILLDNMDTGSLRQAVLQTRGRARLEASGNMTLARIREVAETGVDYISLGALTHSAVSVDVGMDIELTADRREMRE